MKIVYKHLLNFLIDNPSLEDVSKKLFQLGHEHEVEDSVFDIEFTPNRGDCLSLIGLARDLNVFYKTNLELDIYKAEIPKLELNFINNSEHKCPAISFLNIEIENDVKDYKNYLEDYFLDLKLNKNNFFTDVSNYIAYEMGQPTHCYNSSSINADITLTDNIKEDRFKTLLNNEINIDESDLVFLSNNKVINLAGIIGGMNTSCSKKSKNVLVECAYFAPKSIMGKSVKHNLQSDASHKFERGVDPQSQEKVLRRFIHIVSDHAKIKKLSIYKDTFSEFKEVKLDVDIDEINNILGTKESLENFKNSLSKLNFKFDDKIHIPSYRSDIKHQNDLAEEFARVIGYNNIPKKNINLSSKTKIVSSPENNIKSFLIDNGFSEVINYPFTDISKKVSIKVDNPLDSNREYLRTDITNSLLSNVIYNEKRQKDSIKLFEISDIYTTDIKNFNKKISLIVSGRQGHNYKEFNKKLDKNYLINLFRTLDIDIEKNVIEISRDKVNSKIKTRIFCLEINMSEISQHFKEYVTKSQPVEEYVQYEPISEFPSSYRDLSFSVKDSSKYNDLEEIIKDFKHEILIKTFIFDFFIDKKNDQIKIGFRFIFQSKVSTITEGKVNNIINEIIDAGLSIDSVTIPGLNR